MGTGQSARLSTRRRTQLSSKRPQSAGLDFISGFQLGLEPFIFITGQWSQKQAGKLSSDSRLRPVLPTLGQNRPNDSGHFVGECAGDDIAVTRRSSACSQRPSASVLCWREIVQKLQVARQVSVQYLRRSRS